MMKKGLVIALYFVLMMHTVYGLTWNYTQDLISCHPLDINGSDLYNTYDFTESGDAFYSSVLYKVGVGSAQFDGNQDYIRTADNPPDFSISEGFTISFWVYFSGTGSYRLMYHDYQSGANRYWHIARGSNDKMNFHYKDENITTFAVDVDETITESAWYHVVWVWDAKTDSNSVFFNGVNKSLVTNTAYSTSDDPAHYTIGIKNDLVSNDFLGNIDEISYYHRKLNSSEISELYNSGSGVSCADIIASGQGGGEEPPADSCTAPGSGNWAVDCSDYCAWTAGSPDDKIPGNVTLSGSGRVILSRGWIFSGLNQWLNIDSSCDFDIVSGGSIN